MPGRVSARTSTSTRLSRKSSVPTLDSRKSAPRGEIPEDGPSTALRVSVCTVFGESQKSTTGHRKLVVSLRKIQEACCYEQEDNAKSQLRDFSEDDFNAEVARCVIRVLLVKKSEPVGDKVVRFFGQFLRHASEKG